MPNIILRPGWYLPERDATPERAFLNRRAFLKAAGLAGAGWALGRGPASFADVPERRHPATEPAVEAPAGRYPAGRNPEFKVDGPLTDEVVAATHSNFYEFTTRKDQVWRVARQFDFAPWQIEIVGEVEKTGVFDIEDLIGKIPLEERLYRMRCVEAWAMDVPWTGFPLRKLIERLKPTSNARYVAFATFLRPEQAPGQRDPRNRYLNWPYVEGLTMAEATNALTLIATGIYGHALPPAHGAPLRLVVPWKYGFKSIKSIVRIAFLPQQPPTTWSRAMPHEYTFLANVEPHVPHPRWSQETEQVIGTGKRRKTLLYNGYADYVANLYR